MSLLTDELRARVGETVTYTAPEELGRAAIRYFALAVGDENPVYTDEAVAREHGLPGIVAPPTLVCETNQYAGLPRDADGYAGHAWELEVPATALIRGGNTYEFHQPVRPEDVITATWTLADMAERTNAAGRPMLIVRSEARYHNQHGEPLVTNTETMIFLGEAAS
jgi:acyl dehydratase